MDRRSFENRLYDPAVRSVIESRDASTAFLQLRLGIEFGAASRLIDRMCLEGIVSDELPDKTRIVFPGPDELPDRKA
jgi:DNA segregation ATPase FtsK/SpoIIIE-like protein